VANEHEIDLATQTLFAALLQRALDSEFDADFPEKGGFVRKRLKGRLYWYYQWRAGDKVMSKYAGLASDPGIADRVERFSSIKSS